MSDGVNQKILSDGFLNFFRMRTILLGHADSGGQSKGYDWDNLIEMVRKLVDVAKKCVKTTWTYYAVQENVLTKQRD